MSLDNIIKYATKTPVNTNPAVMSGIINDSFKQSKSEILQEAKEYTDSQRLGYKETVKIAYDGNDTDKEVVESDGIKYIKIGEIPSDNYNTVKIEKITIIEGEQILESSGSDIFATDSYAVYDANKTDFYANNRIWFVILSKSDRYGAWSSGIYINSDLFVLVDPYSSIPIIIPEFVFIHSIDSNLILPSFPNITLKQVITTSETVSKQELSVADSMKITTAMKTKLPVLISFTLNTSTVKTIFMPVQDDTTGLFQYQAFMGIIIILTYVSDNEWTLTIE